MLSNVTATKQIARPLKVLIPMIQGELQMGNDAGQEHYRRAGEMLIEAKEQVPHGRWGTWLSKNFTLHADTARNYMRWAREYQNRGGASEMQPTSMRQMTGHTERRREQYGSKQQQDFRRVLRDVARETFIQERQTRDDELRLHRELAVELVTIGYRALATRLHPDRGGSKDAMSRLTRVRDELKQFAETRRFI
jgi:Protein of unknown function (DUF3102)